MRSFNCSYFSDQETKTFMEDNNNKYIKPQKNIVVPFYWHSNFSEAGMNKKFQVARHDDLMSLLRTSQYQRKHINKQGSCITGGLRIYSR